MLTEEQIMERLKNSGALLQGHFKLPSGRHTDQHVECARLLQYPWHATKLCGELAARFSNEEINLVLGPAVGGIVVAFEIGRILKVPIVFTERKNGVMSLLRSFSIREGQRVLIAEDEVVSGKSLREVVDLIEERGASVSGIAALIDRSGGKADEFGYSFKTLVNLDAQTYDPEECPMCRDNIPVSKPSGK